MECALEEGQKAMLIWRIMRCEVISAGIIIYIMAMLFLMEMQDKWRILKLIEPKHKSANLCHHKWTEPTLISF